MTAVLVSTSPAVLPASLVSTPTTVTTTWSLWSPVTLSVVLVTLPKSKCSLSATPSALVSLSAAVWPTARLALPCRLEPTLVTVADSALIWPLPVGRKSSSHTALATPSGSVTVMV